MYFNEKEINIKAEKSLTSLGIKDDFTCKVEMIPIKDS